MQSGHGRGLGLDTSESAIEDDETTNDELTEPPIRRVFGRVSFDDPTRSQHRPSFAARWRSILTPDVETGPNEMQVIERPPIPSALQMPEVPTTPLPGLSMIVLSIVSASVILSYRKIYLKAGMFNKRLCSESFYVPMFRLHFSCSW